MRKKQKTTIEVQGTAIAIVSQKDEDYICITDIARYKSAERTDDLVRNWLRNRKTIEFLGIWEQLNNPGFKVVEFDGFKKQAGLNSVNWPEVTQGARLKRLNEIATRQMKKRLRREEREV